MLGVPRGSRRGGRRRRPTGPVRQRSQQPRNSIATSWRTSTWSRSPASTRVDPRGGIACSPRTMTLSSASRGSPSSRTRTPTDGVARAHPELHDLRAEAAHGAALDERRRHRGLVARDAQPARERLEGRPCSSVETTHGEEDDVEEPRARRRRRSSTGKVARTTGTAPRRPAQPSTSRSADAKPLNAVATNTASGRATTAARRASTVPSTATSPRSAGNTSRPSVKNMPSCATQARPSWKVDDRPPRGDVGPSRWPGPHR